MDQPTFQLDVAMDEVDRVHPLDDVQKPAKHSSDERFCELMVVLGQSVEHLAATDVFEH